MLHISCTDIAKRYIKEILFNDFNYTFEQNKNYAILGENSSGKSTLLKIIGGALAPSKGSVTYSVEEQTHKIFSFCSPEMHLLDDFTVSELFELHFQFKSPKIPVQEQWKRADLKTFLNKKYEELSSGMKNKVKLSLALYSKSPALLLDEPCTNFDAKNNAWYTETIEELCQNQLIIVASNQKTEYTFCTEHIYLHDFKPQQ